MVRVAVGLSAATMLAVLLACSGSAPVLEPSAEEPGAIELSPEMARFVEAMEGVEPIQGEGTPTTVSVVHEVKVNGPLPVPVEQVRVVAPAPVTPAPVAAASRPVAVGPGQIQVTTAAGIQPLVDGVPMRLTETQGYLAEVAPGKHQLEIRNLLGRVTGSEQVDVASGRRTRFEWRSRSLSLLGDVASSPMPPAIDWNAVLATDTPDGGKEPLQPTPAPTSGVKK